MEVTLLTAQLAKTGKSQTTLPGPYEALASFSRLAGLGGSPAASVYACISLLVFRSVCHQSFPIRSGNVRRKCYPCWLAPQRGLAHRGSEFRESGANKTCVSPTRLSSVWRGFVSVVARSMFVLTRGVRKAIFCEAADVCCAPSVALAALRVPPVAGLSLANRRYMSPRCRMVLGALSW